MLFRTKTTECIRFHEMLVSKTDHVKCHDFPNSVLFASVHDWDFVPFQFRTVEVRTGRFRTRRFRPTGGFVSGGGSESELFTGDTSERQSFFRTMTREISPYGHWSFRPITKSAHNQIGPWPFRPIPFRPITISAHNFNIDILFVYLLLYGLMNFNLFKGKSVWRFYFTKKMWRNIR